MVKAHPLTNDQVLLEQQLGDANTNQDTSNSSGESDQDPSLDTSRKSSTAVSEISLQECDTLPDGSAPLIFSDPPFDPMMLFSPPYPLMTYTGDMQDTMDMDMDALSKMNLFTPMDTFSNTLPIENNFNGPSFGLDNVHAIPLTEFQRADLNHLYFDRVHSFVPFLHRRRYFKREAASGNSSAPFTTLQHAMWTMAASMGSQFLDVRATFYATTRSMLERWELETLGEAISIEYVQALILLAIYETTHVSYQRGCMSASRCFRLVQLLKLHKIDDPNSTPDEQGHCEIEREERRRVFWAAYMLDRFLSLFNQSPMTVSEQMILTRLPMPESPFQCSQPLRTDFLAQVISSPPDHDLSPFSETIFWVTIAGRCLAHQQESAIDLVHGGCQIEDSVARYNALSAMLLQKLENASTTAGRMVDDSSEALQLFTNMVSQTALMLLFTAMPAHDVVPTASGGFHGVHVRALAASQTFAGLLQRLSEFSSFKVSPLPVRSSRHPHARDPQANDVCDWCPRSNPSPRSSSTTAPSSPRPTRTSTSAPATNMKSSSTS
jgi:hypothetical protein